MNENIKVPLGVSLISFYTWLGCFAMSLFGIIILLCIITDPGADGMIVGIIALVISFVLAYFFGKLAGMTSRMESKAWWWQMILSAFGLFGLNPISLIIIIYLWMRRPLFGIQNG